MYVHTDISYKTREEGTFIFGLVWAIGSVGEKKKKNALAAAQQANDAFSKTLPRFRKQREQPGDRMQHTRATTQRLDCRLDS